jgi:cell division protein FtsA
MNTSKIISAIDIGTTKIVALTGCITENGKFRLMGIGREVSAGIRRGNIQNIQMATDSIRKAVEKCQEMSGHTIKKVVVGIAGQNIRSILNAGYMNRQQPDEGITQEEVNKLLSDQFNIAIDPGEQIIHVVPKSYRVDDEGGIINPVGSVGKRLEGAFNIVIGRANEIGYIRKCIAALDIELLDIFLEPIASGRAVLTDDEMEAGVAMIDIGGGTSDIAIYHRNCLCHTAVIPFGGNVITNDLVEELRLVERVAEELKRKHGSCLPESCDNVFISVPGISGREPRQIEMTILAEIIKARMEEIIGSLDFQISHSGYAQRMGAGLVITGGGALLKNILQLFSYKTGFDNRIGYPIEHIISENADFVNGPDYSTGVGLLLLANDFGRFDAYEEPVVSQPEVLFEEEEEPEAEIHEKEEVKQRKEKPSRGSLFNKLRDTFSGIIIDKDSEIN